MYNLFRGHKPIPDGTLGSPACDFNSIIKLMGENIELLLTNTIPGGGSQSNDFWDGQNPEGLCPWSSPGT